MNPNRTISEKEKSTATLKELRAMLAKTPEAAKIFYGEVDSRWKLIPVDQRRWVCRLAGCEGVAESSYSKIEKKDQAKIRAAVFRLRRLVEAFEFALKQV